MERLCLRLTDQRNWPPRQFRFLRFFLQRPYRPFPDITLRFYYFWILSKSVERIFYGNLPRARKESSRSEREAASIGGIRCGRINPSRPFCQPEKTGGERETPPAKEKGPREGSPRKGSRKVRKNGNPGKKEIHLSMINHLPIRNLGRGKINPLPALAGRGRSAVSRRHNRSRIPGDPGWRLCLFYFLAGERW